MKSTKKPKKKKVLPIVPNPIPNPAFLFLRFKNLQKAWEGMNLYMACHEEDVVARGGGFYSTELMSYQNYVIADSRWLNPDLDLGALFGYRIKKWSSLVNNYVDFHYLDLLKADLAVRTKRNARSYNLSFHFSNAHGSGKDCLISLNFIKKLNEPKPIVLFTTRASEITKRLIFDFVLVSRIVDYVYGEEQDAEIHFYAPLMFITAESFAMFNNYKPVEKVIRNFMKDKPLSKFQDKILICLKEFMNTDPRTVKFRVNLRSIMQIQRGPDGKPLSGVKGLFIRDLQLRPGKTDND